jgi:hypothetical protein
MREDNGPTYAGDKTLPERKFFVYPMGATVKSVDEAFELIRKELGN